MLLELGRKRLVRLSRKCYICAIALPSVTMTAKTKVEVATFGGGCFWCTEAMFSQLKGVLKVEPGYSGGHVSNPSYEEVCTGSTGHAEVSQVTFDPAVISYRDLLSVFFSVHDPTTLNRQGGDEGEQYRSVIFYHGEDQRREAEEAIRELEEQGVFSNPIVTQLVPFRAFYRAEDYHIRYYERNPEKAYCRAVISPKLVKLREHHGSKIRSN